MGSNNSISAESCGQKFHSWHYTLFLLTGLYGTVLFGSICLKVLMRCIGSEDGRARQIHAKRFYLLIRVKVACGQLTQGANIAGRILSVLLHLLSLLSWGIYIWLLYKHPAGAHILHCLYPEDRILVNIDLVFNLYFLFHFLMRFLAANDKLRFWFELDSFIDMFTIPTAFLAAASSRRQLGFGFIRFLRVTGIYKILVYLDILKATHYIRLTQRILVFIAVWITGAGALHLLENSGNWWEVDGKYQSWTFWDTAYFLMVTMSTVGYGDMSSVTHLGRIFVILYICFALAMFASFIPEIVAIVLDKNLYPGRYLPNFGQAHMVMCGPFDKRSINVFLKDFYHEDRDVCSRMTKMVFLTNEERDLEMEALFERYAAYTKLISGDVNCPNDLKRVKASTAEAIVVVSHPHPAHSLEEDNANIMRVISIKKSDPGVRVVVQLHHYKSKFHLHNLPTWKPGLRAHRAADSAICISELKLGLMAQNSLAPGFSTLLNNLLLMTGDTKRSLNTWRGQFEDGASLEIYAIFFSPDFNDWPFRKVVWHAYKYWGILLVASEMEMANSSRRIIINPSHTEKFVIRSKGKHLMKGFVLASCEEDAKRLFRYCEYCFTPNTPNVACSCDKRKDRKRMYRLTVKPLEEELCAVVHSGNDDQNGSNYSHQSLETIQLKRTSNTHKCDISGTFVWREHQEMSMWTLTPQQASEKHFADHVIVFILDCEGTMKGLCNFVMPLRFHFLTKLRPIIIIGDVEFIRAKEWPYLANFPDVYIIDGDPLNQLHQRQIGIQRCHSCVIVSCQTSKALTDDVTLIDKNSILCACMVDVCVKDVNPNMHLTIELGFEGNYHYFSSVDEMENDLKIEKFYQTEPFARGALFTTPILYSLVSSSFFNPEALTFVQTLLSGGCEAVIEKTLGELGMLPSQDARETCVNFGCQVCLLGFDVEPLRSVWNTKQEMTFDKLVEEALSSLGIICLGLYRLFSIFSECKNPSSTSRFVLTLPSKSSKMYPSDLVYCLVPPHFEVGGLESDRPNPSATTITLSESNA